MEEELKTTNSETAEGRIKSIQFNTLRNRYIGIFKSNNLELENYRNLQKDRLEVQLKAKGVKVTDEELVALLDKKVDLQVFTENVSVFFSLSYPIKLQYFRNLNVIWGNFK